MKDYTATVKEALQGIMFNLDFKIKIGLNFNSKLLLKKKGS